jgi:threonine aldolase
MANAPVGDDVFGDDPTVNELEQYTAELLGKEAAVFVPTGTMANQIALRCHTRPGDGLLLEESSHIYLYEAGASAALSGLTSHLLPSERGIFTPDAVAQTVRKSDIHFPRSRLLSLENTHNRGGGTVWSLEQIAAVCDVAQENNLKLHLDGARLWNATAATGIRESEYGRHFDSVSVCFSKGLGAPVGSALAGSEELIQQARHIRKQFGGGMRQAGIIAAGAHFALEHHRERLVEDHRNARQLADGIRSISGLHFDPDSLSTNMVYFELLEQDASVVADRLMELGVLVLAVAPQKIRAVTSLVVDTAAVERAVTLLRQVMDEMTN